MNWKKKYDIVNYTFDGDIACFGDHYTKKQCSKFMEDHGCSDEELNIKKVEYVWLHFGFITNDDGELGRGWKVLEKQPKSLRGCIKATMVIN